MEFVAGSHHLSRKQVPDSAKKENGGNWVQAPEGAPFEGEWFQDTPARRAFSGGLEPWEQAARQDSGGGFRPKPGFVEVFGEHPEARDFPDGKSYRVARTIYRNRNSNFVRLGAPDQYSKQDIAKAEEQFKFWGLGPATYYVMRDGAWARFLTPDVDSDGAGFYNVPAAAVDALLSDAFGMAADTAILYPHLVIAQFQYNALVEAQKVDSSISRVSEITNGVHPLLTGVA